jgi:hypothetical protein
MIRPAILAVAIAAAGLVAAPVAGDPAPLHERGPATLSEGPRVALPPTVIPLDRPSTDRRPVYVGAALVMLAAALWWNRRQRDRFDREDRGERPARRERARDADADDLHAAARGDAPDPPATRNAPARPNGHDHREHSDPPDPRRRDP